MTDEVGVSVVSLRENSVIPVCHGIILSFHKYDDDECDLLAVTVGHQDKTLTEWIGMCREMLDILEQAHEENINKNLQDILDKGK